VAIGSFVVIAFNHTYHKNPHPLTPTEILLSETKYADDPSFPPPRRLDFTNCSSRIKGHHAISCPVWYDESDPEYMNYLDPISQEKGIDYRVRYLHHHQNPPDCDSQRFYMTSLSGQDLVNILYSSVGRGLWGALTTERVRRG